MPGFWVTNGWDWYETHGDLNDWSYGVRGALDTTQEMTSTKRPSSSEITTYTAQHRLAVRAFLDDALDRALAGRIYDATTGWPLEALVTPTATAGWVPSDPDTGYFYRVDAWYDGEPRMNLACEEEVGFQRGSEFENIIVQIDTEPIEGVPEGDGERPGKVNFGTYST